MRDANGSVLRPAARRPLLALGALLGLAAPAAAQYQVNAWTTDDGLPQNIITGLHQSSDGYLWVATLDGLARFDGVRFTVFNRASEPDIDTNRFTRLYADPQGDLWLGTESGAVIRYTRGRFVTYTTAHGLGQGAVVGFTGDDQGHLWVLADGAIRRWDPGQERFVAIDAPPVAGGYRPMAWSDGGFWGRDSAGIRIFADGRFELHAVPAPVLAEASLVGEAGGAIWIASRGGRLTFAGVRRDDALHSASPSPNGGIGPGATAQVQWRTPSGRSWTIGVGADLGASLLVPTAQGQVALPMLGLYEDREGNLWVGSDGQGLYHVRPRVVTVYSEPQGLVARNVYPIVQDAAGAIWIGAWSGGLSRFQDGRFTSYTVDDGLGEGAVTALHAEAAGRLWIATTGGGVQTFWQGSFTPVDAGFPPGATTVRAIHLDRDGALWIGTENGVVRRQGGAARILTTRDGLATDDARVIIESPDGQRLWIGGYGGLTRWQNGSFTKWTEADGLPGSSIRALYEDGDGVLWIGTYDNGIARLHQGEFTHYTTRHGLFNAGAFQILDDGLGRLWMCSNRGIYRVSRKELNEIAAGVRSELTSVAYGRGDGMLNAECNGGQWPAGVRARDGTLWFPTQDGVAVIDPTSLTANPNPPPVIIESLLLDREPVPLPAGGRALRIPPERSTFEIQYTAPSFINTERIRFRYKLEGLDDDWVDAGTRRTAYYSHVPPGRYVFTVIAANSDGVWNLEGRSLALVVPPPFYRTWWFLSLSAASALALGALAWKRREASLKRAHAAQQNFSRQLIASQEAERKRIAAELHDSLGQHLVIIKNLALMANNDEGGTVREHVAEIAGEASQAIGEVREIAHNLRPQHLDRLGLTRALEALVRRAANASGIALTSDIEGIDGLFPQDEEINIYRIVQECLSNILKHSGATEARVTVERSASAVRITVRDNGRGFAAAGRAGEASAGFGLTGIVERATLVRGRAEIDSTPNGGTTVTVVFAIGNAQDA